MDLLEKIKLERLPLKNLVVFCFIVNLLIIGISLLANLILPPQIPLFFGLPQTEKVLTSPLLLLIPSILTLIIILINTLLALKIDLYYLKKTLAFATFSVTLLNIIATIKIIFLVGSI